MSRDLLELLRRDAIWHRHLERTPRQIARGRRVRAAVRDIPEVVVVSSDPPAALRVFLVDDHELIRAGQRNLLSSPFDIVGEAGTVAEAVAGIRATRPDVVLLDVRLGGTGHGAAVIREVRQTHPDVAFLALSAHSTRDEVAAMVTAGALGYLLKSDTANIELAVRVVGSGVPYFSRELAAMIPSLTVDLAEDDAAILLRLARGYSPAEVAQELALPFDEVNERLGAMLRQLTDKRRERSA